MNQLLTIAVAALLLSGSGPLLGAEQLVSQLSTDTIEITSSFDGERLTLFGAIEPEAGSAEKYVTGPFHVAIVVIGPVMDRVARQKTNNFGIWLNTDQVTFKDFPSYYQVLSSGHLDEITTPTILAAERILPETQISIDEVAGWWKSTQFGQELVRLMTTEKLFGLDESGVNFQSETLYSARLTLPSNAPPGPYIAVTYVFKDGQIVARNSDGFAVRKTGFERFLALESRQNPLAYGLVCVLLALATGWLGGVLFKRS